MLRLIVILFSLSAAPVAAQAIGDQLAGRTGKRDCATATVRQVDGQMPKARVRHLGDMPPAKQYLTVLREVDGCPRPVVLREGIGK